MLCMKNFLPVSGMQIAEHCRARGPGDLTTLKYSGVLTNDLFLRFNRKVAEGFMSVKMAWVQCQIIG